MSCAPPRRTTIRDVSALRAHSASAGCSISATSVCRNCAPSAPSIARWSQVSISRRIGATSSSPSRDDRLVLHRADREDRDLRRIEHRRELLDAEHPEVGDRERPALHVRQRELVVARAADEIGARAGDLLHRPAVGVADHRDDQALRRGDRDPDVRVRVALDLLAGERRVDRDVPHERDRRRA